MASATIFCTSILTPLFFTSSKPFILPYFSILSAQLLILLALAFLASIFSGDTTLGGAVAVAFCSANFLFTSSFMYLSTALLFIPCIFFLVSALDFFKSSVTFSISCTNGNSLDLSTGDRELLFNSSTVLGTSAISKISFISALNVSMLSDPAFLNKVPNKRRFLPEELPKIRNASMAFCFLFKSNDN